MWNKIASAALSGALLMAGQTAQADPRGYRTWDNDRDADYQFARVISSEPIMRRIRVTQPRRECYDETRYLDPRDEHASYDRGRYDGRYDDNRYDNRYDGRDDGRVYGHAPAAGGMIAGGLIGGLIGNQIGHGDGRTAATAAGALIGAAIGHDVAASRSGRDRRNYDQGDGRASTVHHCDIRYDESWEDRVEAYRVTYEYNGRRYTTRMPYDPGQRLRVNVSVQPDDR